MAKAEKDTSSEGAGQVITEEPVPPKPITFRDKEYTSRTLLLPDWRELQVMGARVAVEGTDTAAITFFSKRHDFERLQG